MNKVKFEFFTILQNRFVSHEPVHDQQLAKAKEEIKKAQELIVEIERGVEIDESNMS